MAFWSDRILPHVLDKGCNVAEVIPLRERACRGLRGRVLEIGFGSGFNVGVYPADVAEVAAVEPSGSRTSRATRRCARSRCARSRTQGGPSTRSAAS